MSQTVYELSSYGFIFIFFLMQLNQVTESLEKRLGNVNGQKFQSDGPNVGTSICISHFTLKGPVLPMMITFHQAVEVVFYYTLGLHYCASLCFCVYHPTDISPPYSSSTMECCYVLPLFISLVVISFFFFFLSIA